MTPARRRRLAVAAVTGLVVFLLGSLVHEVRVRDRHIADQNHLIADQNGKLDGLKTANESVVSTLTALILPAIQRGQEVTVEQILQKAPGLDRQIIEEAIRRAQKAAQGPPGPQGKAGPPGQPAAAAAPSTTTTAPGGTSTTTRPAPTTTSTRPSPSTSTTTTTTRCLLSAPGLRLGCR